MQEKDQEGLLFAKYKEKHFSLFKTVASVMSIVAESLELMNFVLWNDILGHYGHVSFLIRSILRSFPKEF